MKNYLTLKLNKYLKGLIKRSYLILIFSSNILFAQNIYVSKTYPKDFRPPLDLPPALAGSFGEIRGNHFHSGLDYRTNQREGYPVYAVADGFVSRLRVQIGGFGNAIYITHPNGYTSVYAHLQKFNDRIGQRLQEYQYKQQAYDIDFPLLPVDIPVKKGEIIAWSGNTGSSGGPHLHFELRDSKTEETINPQLFGLEVPDRVKPAIKALYMYRLNGLPFGDYTPSQYFQVVGSNGDYKLNQSPVINFSGDIGFGITAFDQQLPGGNKNGIYSIELCLDEQVIYNAVWERFAFHNSRAINSHIDFPGLLLHGRTVQKSFIEPGNPLGLYKTSINRGIINLTDDKIHKMTYIVKDAKGNTSTLEFNIKYNPKSVITAKAPAGIKTFTYSSANEFIAENLKVMVPKGVLYDDLNFDYSRSFRSSGYSSMHHVHNRLSALHSNFDLWIKPEREIPADLKGKVLIVDSRGISQGGTYDEKDGFVKASPRAFGSFYISTDTVSPVIRPINISDGGSMKGQSKMTFRISDNLSGIRSFTGTIDGKWVLMEFDSKTATLWHTFDYRTSPGEHTFQLVVTDMKLNSKTYKATFYK